MNTALQGLVTCTVAWRCHLLTVTAPSQLKRLMVTRNRKPLF
jgi:hypothetical protein